MNLSPDVVEQVLWLGLYVFVAIALIAASLMLLVSEYIDRNKPTIQPPAINPDVEREYAKMAQRRDAAYDLLAKVMLSTDGDKKATGETCDE